MSESDTSSTDLSVTSFTDISVCQEIGELIVRCKELHNEINTSFQNLKNIQHIIGKPNNVIVTYNEWTGDFEEILEKIHKNALENIKETGEVNFGQILLKEIDSITFN